MSFRWLAAVATLFTVLITQPAWAIVFQSTAAQTAGLGADQSFLNGEAKLTINLSDGSQDGCSGSLVGGGSYILTAAHCVTGESGTLSATGISIDFANTGLTLSAVTYLVDPIWNGSITNGGDLALIALSTPVTSIGSYMLDTTASAVGDTVTLAGYGLTGVGSTGSVANTFGTLYVGQNIYLGTYSDAPTVYAYGFNSSGPEAVMIAPGDSGGGAFVDVGGTLELAGVHDFITCTQMNCTPNSSFGQLGGDTSIYADAPWLDSILVAEPASLAIMATGLAGMAFISRRRSLTRG
jgi:hypothetical protein